MARKRWRIGEKSRRWNGSGAITTKLLSSDQERSANHALANAGQDFELPRQGHQLYIQRPDTKKFFNYTLFTWSATREHTWLFEPLWSSCILIKTCSDATNDELFGECCFFWRIRLFDSTLRKSWEFFLERIWKIEFNYWMIIIYYYTGRVERITNHYFLRISKNYTFHIFLLN